jgi:putative transposon-encoded protein
MSAEFAHSATRSHLWSRVTLTAVAGAVVLVALLAGLMNASAVVNDSGTVDVRVPSGDNTTSVVDATTNAGAFVSYFGDNDTTFGSSGTGVFDPFVRLQADGTESGYNTDGPVEFDTKTGKWTHAIKVSSIPQRSCPSGTCFELFNDINESNAQQNAKGRISLNKVEVFYANSATVTGYPSFGGNATLEYAFDGDILINDVNQGSGRGDLRYMIPVDGAGGVPLPANCDYGNPACTTWFVLYSEWGLTPTGSAPFNDDWTSDGGFEEWKVKIYPAISLTKTPNPAAVCNGSSTDVTYTYVVTNNSPGGGSVDGTIVDDNATPGNLLDDVTVGTFSNLDAGDSEEFTHVFTVDGTRTNIATATATDSNGETATATATATVDGYTCTIDVTKTPDRDAVCAQDAEVTYDYTVTNTGTAALIDVTATDDQLGALTLIGLTDEDGDGNNDDLAPGASATASETTTLAGTTTNTVDASGDAYTPDGQTNLNVQATDSASATVDVYDCTIMVTKDCVDGTTITFSGTVTNTGTAALIDVTATDDHAGPLTLVGLTDVDGDGNNDDLAAGASATYSDSYVPTMSPSTNTVTATGDAYTPDGQTALGFSPSDSASATCEIPPAEGCTPGYWRQEQHYDSWVATGYAPSDLFSAVFGRVITIDFGGSINNPELGEAIYAQGGGINYIARHGTAALLNAASPDVDYGYSVAEVIAAVQAAIDANDESLISDLAAQNEAGCPLN